MTELDPRDEPAGPAAPPRRTPVPTSATELPDQRPDSPQIHDDEWIHDDHPYQETSDHHDHDDEAEPWIDDDSEHWDDDDDRPGRSRIVVALVSIAVGVALVVGLVWIWYGRQVNPPGPPGAVVNIEVPTGVSVRGIGAILEDKGIISNASVFNFYAGRRGAGPFQAGTYELRANSDFDSVLDALAAGPARPAQAQPVARLSIPEGYTVSRILDRLVESVPGTDRAGLEEALRSGAITSSLRPADQPSFEGLLFPATYEVGPQADAVSLLGDMATEMEVRLDRLGIASARESINSRWGLDLSDYDLLKVASMIQAEAGNPDEAPKIATVIYNRLSRGIPLGIDAVDRYGAELAGTEVDFTDGELPFNTRRRQGLPPTPISAPGEFALEAALVPADGPWLYYVLEAPRSHVFVVTDEEFLAAKRRCRELGLGCG